MAALLPKLKRKLRGLTLAPFADGRYEIILDGELWYSKLATGEFPDQDALLRRIFEHAGI